MSGRVFSNIMRWMCVVIEGKKDDCTDAQLLDRFVQKKDETAFELLVRRHGPMVFAVCRREIQEIHEAEDAFQATFLVLVRKAGELRQPDRLASWLHGVAYRVARKARKLSARRRAEPLNLDDVNGPEQVSDLAWKELQYVLNGEIERLPTKFREPVILCYLNGLTYAAAARRLGVPAGTVSAWLDRARELLRARLVRRGLTFSAGMLGTLMAQNAVAAAVPSSLFQQATHAALAFAGNARDGVSVTATTLAEATLRSLFYARVTVLSSVLVVAATVLGGGFGLITFARTNSGGLSPATQVNKAPNQMLPGLPAVAAPSRRYR